MLKVNRQRTPSVGKSSTLPLARWTKRGRCVTTYLQCFISPK